MAKIVLNPGHGGVDNGASYENLLEDAINLKVALEAEVYLRANGHIVGMTRRTDRAVSIQDAVVYINNANADACISIHQNAGGGDGCEILYQNLSVKSKKLALAIEAEFKLTGQNSRGLKTKLIDNTKLDYFGILRGSKIPAVITEYAFLDNIQDNVLVDTNYDYKVQGIAIAKGIIKYLATR